MEKEVKDFIEFLEEKQLNGNNYISLTTYLDDYSLLQGTKESAFLLAIELLKAAHYRKLSEDDFYKFKLNWHSNADDDSIIGYSLVETKPNDIKINNPHSKTVDLLKRLVGIIVLLFIFTSLVIGIYTIFNFLRGL